MGSRSNFWYDEQNDEDAPPGYRDDDQDDDPDALEVNSGTDRNEWVAHRLLRQSGTALCATTLLDTPADPLVEDVGRMAELFGWLLEEDFEHDPWALHTENAEVELTDPTWTCPKAASDQWGNVNYGQFRHRRRLNEDFGYVSGGETTAVYLADRPFPQFMDVVEQAIQLYSPRPDEARAARGDAARAKKDGDQRDIDILRDTIAQLRGDS